MQEIYIIGAGGFGKEILFLIREINKAEGKILFRGFIDRKNGTLSIAEKDYPIFAEEDKLEELKENQNVGIAIAIGKPEGLRKVALRWKENTQCSFPNLIHPNFTSYRETIKMKEGNIICSGCTFPVDITLGSFNVFNLNVTLGHDSIIGNYNIINPGANISGDTKMGDAVLVGTNATILQGLSIGDEVVIGAGSMVTKPLENGVTVLGNPARIMAKK